MEQANKPLASPHPRLKPRDLGLADICASGNVLLVCWLELPHKILPANRAGLRQLRKRAKPAESGNIREGSTPINLKGFFFFIAFVAFPLRGIWICPSTSARYTK